MPVIPDKSHSPLTLLEIGAIAAIVVIWGANNAAAKVATEVVPPLLTAAIRFAIAALCLIPFVRPPFPNWKSLALIVVLGGPLHYGFLYLGFAAAQDVSPVSVASQLWIPFTALFAFLLLGERLSIAALAGMVVSLAGIVWMSADPHALQDWVAILLIIVAAAFWGVTTVIARRTTSIPPLKMQGLLALVALPTLAFGSATFETGQVEAVRAATPLIWFCLFWAGVVSSVFATSMVFWLVQKREAGRVTPYFLATPVVSIAIGWGLLGDVLTPQILTGAALTLGGVAVVALAERGLRAGAAKA
ncbi:MAG: DMT family transporter [Brevundimonas sp.]|uniref:DMT family transporter n=1 Tax=Brevundimonas sp. TaxID=1871086 RepID=UPI0027324717|nr:DMT family transporter [Brevundimonas sp.]MDP3405640.1 DMT family transporter [Brevundimonas sp.]